MPTTSDATPDATMEAIAAAVALGREGHVESARRDLLAVWQHIGVTGDAFHRCTLAHYLADLYENPAESLVWDVRALDAADALTDEHAQQHYGSLHVAGFYPSLHLNLADNFRLPGTFQAAANHIHEAENHAQAIADEGTARRTSAPGLVQ